MNQISFFGDIGCKEPPEPKPKKKSRPIPEDLPDSAKRYYAERTAKECRREALSAGDKRSMENKIYAWLKEQEIAEEKKIEKEEGRPSIFRERKHRDRNGNLLRTVYPSSSAAYVTWAK